MSLKFSIAFPFDFGGVEVIVIKNKYFGCAQIKSKILIVLLNLGFRIDDGL